MQHPNISKKQPAPYLLGLDALNKIKKAPLSYYMSLKNNHGDAVRIQLGGHRCWFLFHPDHIEQVLAKQADKFIRFERIMKILRQWNGNSLLVAEGESWKERRRKILPAFKQQRMPQYAQMITAQTSALICELTKTADKECEIDFVMAQHALDIAGVTLLSKTFSSQSQEISSAVHALSEIAYRETTSPFLLPTRLSMYFNKNKKNVVRIMKTTIKNIVKQRLDGKESKDSDLLSILIEHHGGDPNLIEEDVMSLLIAGHETSGATLSWLFLLLSQHPVILTKVHSELDSVIKNDFPSFDHLKKLPYLSAVIKETLRLYPAAYALFCRQVISDIELEGVSIRKGDLVQLLPYVTQRDERWFENADTFQPERFLDKEDWPQYAYFPFGAGQRVCIGQSFGMMEVMLTAASVLMNLTLAPEKEKALSMHPRFSLRPTTGSKVTFSKRIKPGSKAGVR